MARPKYRHVVIAAIVSLGTAGCLTVTFPQYSVPVTGSATDQPAPIIDVLPTATEPPALAAQAAPTPGAGASDGTALAVPVGQARPVADPAPTPGLTPAPVSASAVPTPPPPRPTATPQPTPTPMVTASATAAPRMTSPHASNWRSFHGEAVKQAGGVDKATIAGGISCAACHTTHRAADGTVPQSPVSIYTCYSCHNGPKGD